MKLLTPTEVAEVAQVSEATVLRLCRSGQLPAKRVGVQWRVDEDQLAEWLQPEEATVPEQTVERVEGWA